MNKLVLKVALLALLVPGPFSIGLAIISGLLDNGSRNVQNVQNSAWHSWIAKECRDSFYTYMWLYLATCIPYHQHAGLAVISLIASLIDAIKATDPLHQAAIVFVILSSTIKLLDGW